MIEASPARRGKNMIYTFLCRKCGANFEVSETVAEHERHQEKCPKCGSPEVERRFTGGVQVKTSRKS